VRFVAVMLMIGAGQVAGQEMSFRLSGELSGAVRLESRDLDRVTLELDSGLRVTGEGRASYAPTGDACELRLEQLTVMGQRDGLADRLPFGDAPVDRTPAKLRLAMRGDRVRVALYDRTGALLGEGQGGRDWDTDAARARAAGDERALTLARDGRDRELERILDGGDVAAIEAEALRLHDRLIALRDGDAGERQAAERRLARLRDRLDALDELEARSRDLAILDGTIARLGARRDAMLARLDAVRASEGERDDRFPGALFQHLKETEAARAQAQGGRTEIIDETERSNDPARHEALVERLLQRYLVADDRAALEAELERAQSARNALDRRLVAAAGPARVATLARLRARLERCEPMLELLGADAPRLLRDEVAATRHNHSARRQPR
jgi:hypothetical protein